MLELGTKFGHFKILEKLGEGGMGAVYLAEDQKLRRQVALKILSREYFEDEERKLRFEREARVAASINHPNVMAIHEIGEERGPSGAILGYIVMEYVQGQTLGVHLEEQKPEISEIVRLGEKIAAGLASAHKLGIVHRDIKPDNIIVKPDHDPKILDFGVAKPGHSVLALEGDADGASEGQTMTMEDDLTQAGRIVGTVTYMSPEQAQGEPLDTRSDIFAYGILLYRMATGQFPFAGKTSVSVLAKIIEGQHIPPRTQNDEIPAELERILDKCLQKSPADRYRNTEDLVADLRELRRAYDGETSDISKIDMAAHIGGTEDTPGGTGDPGHSSDSSHSGVHSDIGPTPPQQSLVERLASGYSEPRIGRRLTLGVVALLTLVVAFVILRGADGGGSVADASEGRLAILGFENKTGDAELDWLETGLPEILLTDLAQCEGLSLISRDRVTDILKMNSRDSSNASHQEWLSAARQLGATTVLTGSFYKLGPRIRIDARLEDVATGKIVLAEKAIGEDPFTLVDDITLKVATSLHVVNPDAAAPDVTALTTESTEAYKEFLLGQEKLFLGLLEESRTHFQSAIDADSTFALAHMRMAMSLVFDGRSTQSATYFKRAKDFEDRLPPSIRSILSIYNDIWVSQDLSKAMTRMEQYVETYPDDREGKAVYALLVSSLQRDAAKADSLFQEVLQEDPAYPLGLFLYADALTNNQSPERAIEVMLTYQKYHPNSPTSYQLLGALYSQLGARDEAIASYEEFRRRFPENLNVVGNLVSLAIENRDFVLAREHAQNLFRDPDDHFRMVEAYTWQGALDVWDGNLLSAIAQSKLQFEAAKRTGDQVLCYSALSRISDLYREIGDTDNSVIFARQLEAYEGPLTRMNRPLLCVVADPSLADEFRPVMRAAINEFKTNIPDELWPLADQVQDLFDGYVAADTLKLTTALEGLLARPGSIEDGNRIEISRFYIESGQFDEAVPHLKKILDGPQVSRSGILVLQALYYSGRCAEEAGDLSLAIEKYGEMLSYWKDPDLEIDVIRDARVRLAQLSS